MQQEINALTLFQAVSETCQRVTTLVEGQQARLTELENLPNKRLLSNNSWCANKLFDGTRSKFKQWLQDIDKQALLTNQNIPKHLLAYQSSTGAVSEYIHRYMTQHNPVVWDNLQTELKKCFGDIQDEAHAFALLKQIKQYKNEPVQLYAQRLFFSC